MPNQPRFTRRALLAAIGAGTILAQADTLYASTSPVYLGGDGSFNDATDWSGGQTPTSSASTVLSFPGDGTDYTVQLDAAPFSLNRLLFTTGAPDSTVTLDNGTLLFQSSSGTGAPSILQQAGGPAVNISSQIQVDQPQLTITAGNAHADQGITFLSPILQASSGTSSIYLTSLGSSAADGYITFAGTGSNYTGGTSVNSTTVQVNSTSALGPGTLSLVGGGLVIPDSANVDISHLNIGTNRDNFIKVQPNASLDIGLLSGTSSENATLLMTGGGSISLDGFSDYQGGATVEESTELLLKSTASMLAANQLAINSGGSVELDSTISGTAAIRSISLDGGSFNANQTATSIYGDGIQVGESGTLSVDSSGSLTTARIYRDPLLGASGTASLLINGGGSIEAYRVTDFQSNDTITIESGAKLTTRDSGNTIDADIEVKSSGTLAVVSGTLTLNSVRLDGGSLDIGLASGTVGNNLLVGSSATIAVDRDRFNRGSLEINQLTRDPLLGASGTASLLITGGGSVQLDGGPSGFTSDDRITIEADVQISDVSALGQADLRLIDFGNLILSSGTATLNSVTLGGQGSIDARNASETTIENLHIASSGSIQLGIGGVTVDSLTGLPQPSNDSESLLYVRDNGSLNIKDGSGFSGELSLYEGGQASITGATLEYVSLWRAGSAFGGYQTTVTYNVWVDSGAIIAPGVFDALATSEAEKTGQLTFEDGVYFRPGGIYQWQLGAFADDDNGAAGVDFDQLVITGGDLDLGTDFLLDIDLTISSLDPNSNPQFWRQSHLWTIIDLQGDATNLNGLGSANLILPDSIDPLTDGTFNLQIGTGANLGDLQLVYTAVPEPTTLFMMSVGALGLLRRRRRPIESQYPR